MYTDHITATRRTAHLAAVPEHQPPHVIRTCWCGWEIIRPPGRKVEMEAMAHHLEEHTTAYEHRRVDGHLAAWQEMLEGELPSHLLVGFVERALASQDAPEGVAA